MSALEKFWAIQTNNSKQDRREDIAQKNVHFELLYEIIRRNAAREILGMEPNDQRRRTLMQIPGLLELCHTISKASPTDSWTAQSRWRPAKPVEQETSSVMLACQLGEQKAVHMLITQGEDPLCRVKNGLLPLHFVFMFEDSSRDPRDLIHCLLPSTHGSLSSVLDCVAGADNFADVLFPLPPQGSPLSFAIFAGCKKVSRLLLEAGASPLGNLLGNTGDSLSSPKYLAIPLHFADLFLLLWEYAVTKSKSGDHELELSPDKRCVLISGLSVRSFLDLYIVHGSRSDAARQDIIRLIFSALLPVSPSKGNDMLRIPFPECAPILANSVVPASELSEQQQATVPKKLIAAIARALAQTIELGNLEMAYAVSQELEQYMALPKSSRGYCAPLKEIMNVVLLHALQVASEAHWSLTRSLAFIAFAQKHEQLSDLNTNICALAMAV
jgi:hypothetical protein